MHFHPLDRMQTISNPNPSAMLTHQVPFQSRLSMEYDLLSLDFSINLNRLNVLALREGGDRVLGHLNATERQSGHICENRIGCALKAREDVVCVGDRSPLRLCQLLCSATT
jgi:hypothetical protein